MKIVIAPDSYKGSIYASDAARAMADGVRRVLPDAEVVLVPVADGGDGTLETLVETSGGRIITSDVTGPLGETVSAEWGAMGDGVTAVAEMARTSGLALVRLEGPGPPERDDIRAGRGDPGGPGGRVPALHPGHRRQRYERRRGRDGPGAGRPASRRRRRGASARWRGAGEARPHRRVGARPEGGRGRVRRGVRRQQSAHRPRGGVGGLRAAEGRDARDGRAARRSPRQFRRQSWSATWART